MTIALLNPRLQLDRPLDPRERFVTSRSMTAISFRDVAAARGHDVVGFEDGEHTYDEVAELVSGVDAVVFSHAARPAADDEARAQTIAHRFIETITTHAPDAHLVLSSHFLVGHGRAHPNAKEGTWPLHELERLVRAHARSWTILRPTWLSVEPAVEAYSVHATQNPVTDGLVTSAGVSTTAIDAIEQRDVAHGKTIALYSAVPEVTGRPTWVDFAAFRPDPEAEPVGVPA